jgi:hypothetical protein
LRAQSDSEASTLALSRRLSGKGASRASCY